MINDDLTDNIKAWNYKYLALGRKIGELEINQDRVVKLLAYLLKTQLVEFELRRFIPDIDSYIGRKKTRTFNDIRSQTLGQLSAIIKDYSLEWLQKLSQNLDDTVKIRNELQHHLFDEGYTLNETEKMAIEGMPKAQLALNEMDNIIDEIIDKKLNWDGEQS